MNLSSKIIRTVLQNQVEMLIFCKTQRIADPLKLSFLKTKENHLEIFCPNFVPALGKLREEDLEPETITGYIGKAVFTKQ